MEMADSCHHHPTLAYNNTLAALGRAFSHNALSEPAFVAAEVAKYYLPARADGRSSCSAAGDATASPAVPRCCRVYEDFFQDLNMQCSEDVLFDAIRTGAAKARVTAPPLYGWRFDAVQQCPPATWGCWSPGGCPPGTNPVHSCFHTMDLSWMFGTISGFWPWVIPPNHAERWSCSWSQEERGFSDQAISFWVQQAASAPDTASWPPHTAKSRSRLNLRFGNITSITNFRKTQCEWWSSVYQRVRESQGYPNGDEMVVPPAHPALKADDGTPGAPSPAAGCMTDLGCSLNGRCASHTCACRKGWKGDDCSVLNFGPASLTEAFHRPLSASWGGGVIFAEGQFHLFVAVMERNCGLDT